MFTDLSEPSLMNPFGAVQVGEFGMSEPHYIICIVHWHIHGRDAEMMDGEVVAGSSESKKRHDKDEMVGG